MNLPARPPRPLAVHAAVDSAVAFLGMIVVGLILGASIVVVAVLAVVVGALAAPFTRRAEARALAVRPPFIPGAEPGDAPDSPTSP
jgi:hypothetical protein